MNDDQLLADLLYLKLAYLREHHQALAKEAVAQNRTHLDFLSRLVEGEALQRKDRATQRRIQMARFPVVLTPTVLVRVQARQPINFARW